MLNLWNICIEMLFFVTVLLIMLLLGWNYLCLMRACIKSLVTLHVKSDLERSQQYYQQQNGDFKSWNPARFRDYFAISIEFQVGLSEKQNLTLVHSGRQRLWHSLDFSVLLGKPSENRKIQQLVPQTFSVTANPCQILYISHTQKLENK